MSVLTCTAAGVSVAEQIGLSRDVRFGHVCGPGGRLVMRCDTAWLVRGAVRLGSSALLLLCVTRCLQSNSSQPVAIWPPRGRSPVSGDISAVPGVGEGCSWDQVGGDQRALNTSDVTVTSPRTSVALRLEEGDFTNSQTGTISVSATRLPSPGLGYSAECLCFRSSRPEIKRPWNFLHHLPESKELIRNIKCLFN